MVVSIDHVLPATTFATLTEAHKLTPGLPISVPVSELIPVPNQLGSAGGRGLETPPTVSDHAVLTIVIANYWSSSTCLWQTTIVQNKISL